MVVQSPLVGTPLKTLANKNVIILYNNHSACRVDIHARGHKYWGLPTGSSQPAYLPRLASFNIEISPEEGLVLYFLQSE